MSKSSTVTSRDTALSAASSASASGLVIVGEMLTIATTARVELVDLTERVMEIVTRSAVREGIISLWSMHTTCALFINEAQDALHADIKTFLERMVARDEAWMHNDPTHSDCDRRNADSHLRALLLGHSLTLQVSEREVVLGQWQRVLMAELDGPRERNLRAQVWGIG